MMQKQMQTLGRISPVDANALAYLLKSYDWWKADGAKITMCNCYNIMPDDLKDIGVCFIKCDTSFLPCHVGIGAGKEDFEQAKKAVQDKKRDALMRAGKEAVDRANVV